MSKWKKHPSLVWSETIVDESGETVCSVACTYRTRTEVEKTVNLVIAAPELLTELEIANKIIINALNIMTNEQKDQWALKNANDGLLQGSGVTRNHERELVLRKATGKPC